jgi:ribosomal protein S18 acetylase RimI-like enzyme
MGHTIVQYQHSYREALIGLIAKFRVSLRSLKGCEIEEDLKSAEEELDFYRRKKYSILLALGTNEDVLGYIIIKIEEEIVWAESLYVSESSRQKGIGGDLYYKAEEIAQKFQQDTIYNWIHPNNTKIIHFLKKRGYNVLNLVEIRKKRKNEIIQSTINIGDNSFDY